MGIAVTCQGCGRRLPVADDFQRRKVRCPDCGVYCEVTAPVAKGKPVAPQPAKTSAAPKVDDEDIFAEAYRETGPPPAPAKVAPKTPVQPEPPVKPSRPIAAPAVDKDDGQAYRFADADLIQCADCRKQLPADTQVCPHCGFNLETGEKAVRIYPEIQRTWEAGMPFAKRRWLFILAQVVVLPLAIFGAVTTGYWTAFLTPWFWFTALLAFLLGTFDRLDLSRDKKGKVKLSKTWRVFFWPRAPRQIRLAEYEGVATGPADRSVVDWVICFLLLPAGIVPAVIFWYLVLLQDNFHVSLTQHHGFPEMPLYQGSNQQRVHEIAATLHDVAAIPYS